MGSLDSLRPTIIVRGIALECSTITRYSVSMSRKPTRRPQGRLLASTCPIEKRPLISRDDAESLMAMFKIFASDTRLRLLHALVRNSDMCVTDLARATGMKPQAVSNQLQRLLDRGIVGSRRNGNNIHYWITDPCVPVLLERGICLIECTQDRGSRPKAHRCRASGDA